MQIRSTAGQNDQRRVIAMLSVTFVFELAPADVQQLLYRRCSSSLIMLPNLVAAPDTKQIKNNFS